jgi:hypothetical protein
MLTTKKRKRKNKKETIERAKRRKDPGVQIGRGFIVYYY